MSAYLNDIKAVAALKESAGNSWSAITPSPSPACARQNRLRPGWTIAKYTAASCRKEHGRVGCRLPLSYTQSWLLARLNRQQKLISSRTLKTTNQALTVPVRLDVAALRSDFGPLPEPVHDEKTAVSGLIEELYNLPASS